MTAAEGAGEMALPPASEAAWPSRWEDAITAARLLAVDPVGLGGAAVRAGPGVPRDRWFAALRRDLAPAAPVKRIPPGIEDDRLLGGVDLVATLGAGRVALQRGVLAEADGGILVIPLAERLSAGTAARIAASLDRRSVVIERDGIAGVVPTRLGVVLFDEGATPDERPPAALVERLAFHIDLSETSLRAIDDDARDDGARDDGALTARARRGLGAVDPAAEEIIEALVATASALGIASVVAPLLALRAARAAAALAGRRRIETEDAILAARLVLGPRACVAPAEEPPAEEGAPDDKPEPAAPTDGDASAEPKPLGQPDLEELILAAVKATLPDGLLAGLSGAAGVRQPPSHRQGVGAAQAAPTRGRPAGVRPGALRSGARLALVDTLRAAAPWQRVRRIGLGDRAASGRIEVRRDDFRLRKFVQRRETTIVFCVDASGSAALHRLAETKGAVELLLSEAYVARTHVALVVFRGSRAELLLPPTRSLSRAKALLAHLPGGGGTPLAAGIDAAVLTALLERAKGREPLLVLMTDGRANIGRDGRPARPAAAVEALASARQVAVHRLASVLVDTAPRPSDTAAALASAMNGRYAALPYVEASAMRDVVRAATPLSGPRSSRAR
jgi:magnesium chelatase subunit D